MGFSLPPISSKPTKTIKVFLHNITSVINPSNSIIASCKDTILYNLITHGEV